MPRMRDASKASRSVTTKVAPMTRRAALLRHDAALGRLGVVLALESVGARLEPVHLHPNRLAGGNDLLDPEVVALELLGRLVLVGDDQDERAVGLDPDLFGLEPVVLDRQSDLRLGAGGDRAESARADDRQSHHAPPEQVHWPILFVRVGIHGALGLPNSVSSAPR